MTRATLDLQREQERASRFVCASSQCFLWRVLHDGEQSPHCLSSGVGVSAQPEELDYGVLFLVEESPLHSVHECRLLRMEASETLPKDP